MIARISSGSSPDGAVFYNEHKVGKGEAVRLTIRNFEGVRVPTERLTATMVADKLVDRAALNDRIKLPTFHVSLALAKGEEVPAHDLVAIADQYMQGMGYGRQPYAVYKHSDTEHPHIHIVSVRIDENTKKIPDSYERERSNKLRQQIEKDFGLQVAEAVGLRQERTQLKPVEYGKGDLRADLSGVVQAILKDFTFNTFTQFNQLLKLYNVQAIEIPREGQKPGLTYSAIDAAGGQLGTAIKASSLPYRPTREVVERRINAGKKIKEDRIGTLRKAANGHLGQSQNWTEFGQRLSQMGVHLIPHQGEGGNLFGVSYLDVRQRIIYTGSELGKSFTAGSLKRAFGENFPQFAVGETHQEKPHIDTAQPRLRENVPTGGQADQAPAHERQPNEELPFSPTNLLGQLLYALGEQTTADSEQDLKKMLKKSRKPRLS